MQTDAKPCREEDNAERKTLFFWDRGKNRRLFFIFMVLFWFIIGLKRLIKPWGHIPIHFWNCWNFQNFDHAVGCRDGSRYVEG